MAQLWPVWYVDRRALPAIENRVVSAFIFLSHRKNGFRNAEFSERFGGDLGGERRADGRMLGDYHVGEKLRSKLKRGSKVVPVLGRRRLSLSLAGGASAGRCASCGCADAQGISKSRNHARRGGNRRHQLGDILCLRQRKCRTIAAQRKAGVWLLDGHLLHSGNDAYPTPLRAVTQ